MLQQESCKNRLKHLLTSVKQFFKIKLQRLSNSVMQSKITSFQIASTLHIGYVLFQCGSAPILSKSTAE